MNENQLPKQVKQAWRLPKNSFVQSLCNFLSIQVCIVQIVFSSIPLRCILTLSSGQYSHLTRICLFQYILAVTAMDGRVYERNAIQTHINERHSRSGTLKSPITNQPMGTTILPNPQAKNIIETAIQNGDIPEDLAKGWKDKMKKREELEENKRAALTGNGKAAVLVAKTFHFGTDLVMKDNIEAAKWWKNWRQMPESLSVF